MRVFSIVFAGALLVAATAVAKPNAAFKPFLKSGTEWKFQRVLTEPGSPPQTVNESWLIVDHESLGGGAVRVAIVITEDSGYSRDRQADYVISGSRFYDISWLERGRHTPDIDAEMLKTQVPLFDVKQAKVVAKVLRYPDNPMAFVRFQKLKEFVASNGIKYKGVIAAIRNRGKIEPTDKWWYHPRKGIVQLELQIPTLGGGGTMTWKRLP